MHLSETQSAEVTVGDVSIDIDERRVMVGGQEVKLTPKEFDVLKYLVSNAGKVVTHRALLQAVWGSESSEQTEYLRVFINQLRRKIEPDSQHPRYIITEPWVGYRFMPHDA
jgi:two-component system KDP operon response regulator KdpE